MYNVTCDPSDNTQLGWSHDAESQAILAPGANTTLTCMDWKTADNRQMWAVNCTGVQAQRWSIGSPDEDGFATLIASQNHNTLTIPGRQNSVELQKHTGSGKPVMFRFKGGQLQSSVGSCLAARAINPPQCLQDVSPCYQLIALPIVASVLF